MNQPQWHFDLSTNPGRNMPLDEDEILLALEMDIENNPDRIIHESIHCQTYKEAYSLAEKIGFEYHSIHWTAKSVKDRESFYVHGVRIDSLGTKDELKSVDDLMFEHFKAELASAKMWRSELATLETAKSVINRIKEQNGWTTVNLLHHVQGYYSVFASRWEGV